VAYVGLLKKLEKAYADIEPYAYARDYYSEIASKIEILGFANELRAVVNAYEKNGEAGYAAAKDKALANLEADYKDYNTDVDKKLFEVLMEMYVKDQKDQYVSPYFKDLLNKSGNDYAKTAAVVFERSKIYNMKDLQALLTGNAKDVCEAIKNDVACQLTLDMQQTYRSKVADNLNAIQVEINQLQRLYMQAQMDVFTEKAFYPDANSTLRVTYGNVKSSEPRDGVKYEVQTYMEGVMEKYVPGDYEFDLPKKMIDLYNKKDFGRWGVNGRQPVCFIAANHTTGGNSGSPALDAYGNLVGLNFDRAWEGTMSDINYDPSICRNIMVDIRYVMFIVDKFAEAKNLIAEMKFVSKKGK
jgi:hypothetical protein